MIELITERPRRTAADARPDRVPAPAPEPRRIVIGIGGYAVSDVADALLITHALGSCVAVCLWDPVARVGGLLHFLLPDSRINMARAEAQPGAFADTGIPILFQTAYRLGVQKDRCLVRLVGGADVSRTGANGLLNVGKRNVLAARNLLWRNGVLVHRDLVGGSDARTVTMSVGEGWLRVSGGGTSREL